MKNFQELKRAPRISLNNVSKFWEREFSIFTMSSWRTSLPIINSRIYGNNSIRIFICTYQNGIAMHFRSSLEENRLEMLLGNKFIRKSGLLRQVIGLHTHFAKKLLLLYTQLDKGDNPTTSLVKEFNINAGKFFGYNTLIQRAIDYVGELGSHKRLSRLLIRQRTRYERSVVGRYEFYLDKICQRLFQQHNIPSPKLLKLLTLNELINFIRSKKVPRNLKQRNQAAILILLPRPVILTGRSAINIIKRLELDERKRNRHLVNKNFLIGTPVYPGKVRGRVQRIVHLKDLDIFCADRILVAPTTLPKYVILLKTAKAIITDEGGLLSHGAVLSREYKIPGIVGTEMATKFFKDGDLVEVDANKGIVKILKRGK